MPNPQPTFPGTGQITLSGATIVTEEASGGFGAGPLFVPTTTVDFTPLLLAPVPEPSTWVMLLTGFAAR